MPQFAHRRTVRLIVEDDMEIDSLEIAKSLPDFAENIIGIVPQFGGKCFDITLTTAEDAIKLSTTGFDYGSARKPLRLLGAKSIHVSIFVSVEFPDENLLALLEQYGELKSRNLRRLHFQEEGFTHIERGVRVAEFIKINRDIPKKIVLAGIEVGFKYSGQPATCYRCQSTEHVVKDCPKRRRPPPPRDDPTVAEGGDSAPADSMETQSTAPSLFTNPSGFPSYAGAVATASEDEFSNWEDVDLDQLQREQDAFTEDLKASRGRKREPPPASSSDDEVAPHKKQVPVDPPVNEHVATPTISGAKAKASNNTTKPSTAKSTQKTTPQQRKASEIPQAKPAPAGLKKFITALAGPGPEKTTLMNTIPADIYYKCRGFYLQHKHGNFSTETKVRTTEKDRAYWAALQGTIRQDAFGPLLAHLKSIQSKYGVFTTD